MSVTYWYDIAPEDAAEIDLTKRDDIRGPLNEAGEPCPWPWEPQQMVGVPLGQYRCGYCGAMVMAGVPHLDYDETVRHDEFCIVADEIEPNDCKCCAAILAARKQQSKRGRQAERDGRPFVIKQVVDEVKTRLYALERMQVGHLGGGEFSEEFVRLAVIVEMFNTMPTIKVL